MTVLTGLDQLASNALPSWKDKRIGLLCNSASVDRDFVHTRKRLHALFDKRLVCLFSPQHGLFAEKQDNMVESTDRRDPLLGVPVYSLYSGTREPSAEMFADIDVLIVDLQDVGTRVYTFVYTMSYCMEAARREGIKVVVLDRPNPVGGDIVEGNCLAPDMRSFVGRYQLPMRHGMTIGELAQMFNTRFGIGCDLEVVSMQGWRRDMLFNDTGLPWVAPSPNLPTPASALVYPGQVIWEGTNISEGRGTTMPFEIFGAPFLDPHAVSRTLPDGLIQGAVLRPLEFEPTANKWCGQVCRGFQIHVTQARRFRPYLASLALLQAVIRCGGEGFEWKMPPYEYETERMPIDLIIGDRRVRERFCAMVPVAELECDWAADLSAFDDVRHDYFLY